MRRRGTSGSRFKEAHLSLVLNGGRQMVKINLDEMSYTRLTGVRGYVGADLPDGLWLASLPGVRTLV